MNTNSNLFRIGPQAEQSHPGVAETVTETAPANKSIHCRLRPLTDAARSLGPDADASALATQFGWCGGGACSSCVLAKCSPDSPLRIEVGDQVVDGTSTLAFVVRFDENARGLATGYVWCRYRVGGVRRVPLSSITLFEKAVALGVAA
jgi:hypothetical protein